MPTREESMQQYGVLECPDWCLQDQEEVDHEQHVGEWVDAVVNGGVENDFGMRVRPRRGWWYESEGEESDCPSYVEMETIPASAGLPEWLRPEDVASLIQALESTVDLADGPRSWVWAYEGAEDDAEPDEEGTG